VVTKYSYLELSLKIVVYYIVSISKMDIQNAGFEIVKNLLYFASVIKHVDI